ncbi:odorant receptor 131-2-like [Salarias fasciatus]|uniref:odorant receptor 131-2-like n=1 Tax=Salarias fasciatus TaxID=181472 RepID=UPI0011769019|nr:odorant receptor 131-2-like [Salarias fasciatus]XP_029948062.1 odorant receptor 131-2-like [Salarias fasciatus]
MNQTTVIYRDSLTEALIKNMVTLTICVSIIYINGMLVHIFTRHQIFYMNPRYILYIHLVINDIIVLIVYILLQALTYNLSGINVSLCIILIVTAVLSNQNNPLTIALMSVECYVAVCFPLHHSRICSVRRTYVLIALIWLANSLSILPDVFVTLGTETTDFLLSRTICMRKLVLTNIYLTRKRSISDIVFLVLVWLIVFFAYFKILLAAKAATANAKKAQNTILLHGFQLLLCMLNFLFTLIVRGLVVFFPRRVLHVRFMAALFIQVLPRLINPIIYGIRDKMFRKYLKRYLLFKNNANIHPLKTQKRSL